MQSAAPARYDAVARTLHWALGAALLAQMSFGFLLDELAPRNTPARAAVINLHKSCGLVLLVLIVLRLAWRLRHRAPPWPAAMPAWQRRAAGLGHGALYACMLLLPAAGYVASNFSKHGIKFFGRPLPPWGPDWPAAYAFFNGMHDVLGWSLAVLVAGHVAMAAKHAWIDRDGIVERMAFGRGAR
jgi:cytochrome b561